MQPVELGFGVKAEKGRVELKGFVGGSKGRGNISPTTLKKRIAVHRKARRLPGGQGARDLKQEKYTST